MSGAPFDFQAELAALQQKQKLAEALRAQTLAGQHKTGGGLGGLINAGLNAWNINKMDQDVKQGSADLSGRYKAELGKELETYLNTRQGRGENMFNPQELSAAGADAGVPQLPQRNAIPADPRKAAVGAFASQFPQLQELGKSDLSSMGKASLTPKDVMGFSGMDPQTKILAAQLISAGVPETQVFSLLRPEAKEHVVNGQILRSAGNGQYGVAADARDRFGGVGPVAQGPNGPIYGQANTGTGEVKFAPTGTNVNVNTQKKAGEHFATELAGERAKILSKSFENATNAAKSLQTLDSAKQQLEAGIKSGSLANLNLAVGKIGEMLGMQADPATVNTESYRAAIAQQVAQFVKNFGAGTGISNTDLEFALRSMGGDITTSAPALLRILELAKVGTTNTLVNHDRLLGAQRGATGALPEDLRTFEVPFEVSGSGMEWSPLNQGFRSTGAKQKPRTPTQSPGQPSRKLNWND